MNNISSIIAKTLKDLRKQQGWSLDKAAQVTGVSKAMLGQIERQESSPTIATLWKIATGFQMPFSSFLEENQLPGESSVHSQHLDAKDKGMSASALFPFDKQTKSEIFTIELLPNCEHLSSSHENGVIEHVIVIDGEIEVLLDAHWKLLTKGQGIRFNANQLHGYRNSTTKMVYFYNIIHYVY